MGISRGLSNERKKPDALNLFAAVSGLAFLVALLMVVYYAPREQVMGDVQRIFYFHVAAGWVGGLAYGVAAVCGALYLWKPHDSYDDAGHAAVEIGLVFTLVNVVTGSIWARPIWNTWWTWDPRLVTATVMAVMYAGYLLLRHSIANVESRSRIAAGYALLSFLSVPMTFFSIRLFRTIHPVVFGTAMQGDTMTGLSGRMLVSLAVSLLSFTFLFVVFLIFRIRLARLSRLVEDAQWARLDAEKM